MKAFVQKNYIWIFTFLLIVYGVIAFIFGYQISKRGAKTQTGIVFSCEETLLKQNKINTIQNREDLANISPVTEDVEIDSQNQNNGAFVGSKNGTKYYTPGCPATKRIKTENYIWFQSEEDANLQGYTKGSC